MEIMCKKTKLKYYISKQILNCILKHERKRMQKSIIKNNLKLFRQSLGSPLINKNFQKELIELVGAPCAVVEIKKTIGT